MKKYVFFPLSLTIILLFVFKVVNARIVNPSPDLSAAVTIGGNLTVNGTGSSTFAGPLKPSSNNTLDIGGFGSAWKNIFASGTVRGNIISVPNGTVSAPSFTFDSDSDSGFYKDTTGLTGLSVTIDGVQAATFAQNEVGVIGASAGFSCRTDSSACLLEQKSGIGTMRIRAGGNVSIETWNGSSYVSRLTAIGNQSAGQINVFGQLSASSSITSDKELVINGTGTSSFKGHISPTSTVNNTLDIGGFTSAWRDIYASGTLRIGTFIANGSGTSTIKGDIEISQNSATNTLQVGRNLNTTRGQGGCIALKDGSNTDSFIYVFYNSAISSGLATGTDPSVCY